MALCKNIKSCPTSKGYRIFNALHALKTRSMVFSGVSTSYLKVLIITKHCLISSKNGLIITVIGCDGWPNNCSFALRSCNLVSSSAIVYTNYYYYYCY